MPAPPCFLLTLLTVVALCAPAPAPAFAASGCTVGREFARLQVQVPGLVGACLAGKREDPKHGVVQQLTTRGLLVYWKKRDLAAFTDGSTTWLVGPNGLASRSNDGSLFPWEVAKPGRQTSELRQAGRGVTAAALSWPVAGPVTTYFGEVGPYSPRGHQGLDISARAGTPVRSAAAGRVTAAGWEAGYGLRVVLEHGSGLSTLYAHLSVVEVGVGEWVTAGRPIGRVGCTGLCTGPHLHFEARSNGVLRNPLLWLP